MEGSLATVGTVISVYGLKIIAAIVIYMVGKLVAKFLRHMTERLMIKSKVEPTLVNFVSNLVYIALLAFVIIAALGKLGVHTASFVAVLGAAGLAVGLALQGSLSNFAAGVLLIFFKPFKVDDVVEVAGIVGVVEGISIFTTELRTPDNKLVIIPNSKITADKIVNINAKPTRRVDMVFGVSYGDDLDKVKTVIQTVLEEDERILKEPAATVAVNTLADSSVNLVVRPWVNTADYWNVYFDLTEKMKKRFDAEGISIPFPQRDVHMHEVKG